QAHSASSGQGRSPASGQVRPGTSKAMTPSQSEGYWQIGIGAVLAERYRVVAEIREGIGGRVFLAKDEKATGRQPAGVGLKLLHPTIASDVTLLNRVENEIGAIRSAIDPHLLRYFSLEREAP